ncbi:MAG TPA: DMT family transporter [Nitrosomonas sp.]|nr:DMT family transporter [Nitrosomonas sp.]HMV11769.1 DMT family transporter [Nitrosomonas sp.]HMW21634.1 DMT family transporter [Nitrosomonas sp.]HMW70001.1 DMT family transporter [Nitrosomonas sp.]HMY62483.1 DMT family transporter [Nitrosomonas sp.]
MHSLWMLVAGFMFACMGLFVKLGAAHFTSTELVFYRSLFGLIVTFLFLTSCRMPLTTVHWKIHCWRGLFGLGGLLLFFYCLTQLPLATAVSLNNTWPLFLIILATLILKEHLHWPLACAVMLGFTGVLLLLQPTLNENQLFAGLLGVISGFLASIAHFNVKQLGKLGESDWLVVFYFTLISTIITGIWLTLTQFSTITPHNLLLLIGVGLTATLAQLALTRAYRMGKTMVIGALAYSTVLFSGLWDVYFWEEVLPISAWAGMGLIILGGILSIRVVPKGIRNS